MPRTPRASLQIEASHPPRWESPAVALRLKDILIALEIPLIEAKARDRLHVLLHRHGPAHVTLLIRTIIESEGNQDALVEPVVSAISICMDPQWTERGLAWLEAFDKIPLSATLAKFRELDDAFRGETYIVDQVGHYFTIWLRRQLERHFAPPPPPPKVRPARPPKGKRKLNGASVSPARCYNS
jgi:hypothetical protein